MDARRRRRLLWGLAISALPMLAIGLWVAIHRIPWLGPLLADGARAIVGPAAVAKVEDSRRVAIRIRHSQCGVDISMGLSLSHRRCVAMIALGAGM